MCLEELSESQENVVNIPCWHNMHKSCLMQYLKTNLNCPVCRKSIIDPEATEEFFDKEFASYIMPLEYRFAFVNIFCHDCEQNSEAPFHPLGAKCPNCRSYNTTRDKGDIFYLSEAEIRAAANAADYPDYVRYEITNIVEVTEPDDDE